MVSPAATSRVVTTTLTESVSFLAMIADDSARRMPEKAVAPTETAIAAAATAVRTREPLVGPAGAAFGAARRGAGLAVRLSGALSVFPSPVLPKRGRRFSSRPAGLGWGSSRWLPGRTSRSGRLSAP